MRGKVPWGVLALLFVVVPIIEIYILIQVGQEIGAWWTIGLLIADGVLGSYLIKHEGARAWRALREAIASHRMPARELADGALILIGGTLLLTPGFLSDVVGFFFVLPVTRPVARTMLTRFIARKLQSGNRPARRTRPGRQQTTQEETQQRPGPDSVVQGEVVD